MYQIHTHALFILSMFCISNLLSAQEQQPQASIRTGSSLSTEEQQWLTARTQHVKQALEQLLDRELTDTQVPRIALCLSGGGYRAMLSTIGMIQGATTTPQPRSIVDDIVSYIESWFDQNSPTPTITPASSLPQISTPQPSTLFDTVSYCTALSGSTWALAPWAYSRMNINTYSAYLATSIQKSLMENINFTVISKALAKKHRYDQPSSLVDIYGSLLAQKLLTNVGNNPYDTVLTNAQSYTTPDTMPFLIYTSIIGETAPDYQWVEYTPYEIGSTYLNAWIPTQAFNKKFNAGISHDNAPEQPLSLLLGIWGSAMCMTAQEFVNLIKPDIQEEISDLEDDEQEFVQSIESVFDKNIYTTLRLSPARVYNWTFNCPETPLSHLKTITLVDAGIDFRIPTPPLLRNERHVDIIIIMDASDRPVGTELRLAQAYAQKYGLPFPTINYQSITEPFSVHGINDTNGAPIIIYMPLVQNPGYNQGWDPRAAAFTSTYNFKYTQEQSSLLIGLTKYTMIEHYNDILATIKQWITKQSN